MTSMVPSCLSIAVIPRSMIHFVYPISWSVSFSLSSNRRYCPCMVAYKTSFFLQSFSILIYRSFVLWPAIGPGEFLAFFTVPTLSFKSFNVFPLCFECRSRYHPNTALYLIWKKYQSDSGISPDCVCRERICVLAGPLLCLLLFRYNMLVWLFPLFVILAPL